MDTSANEGTRQRPAGKSGFPWVPAVGVAVAIAGVGAAGFAMSKRAARPEPQGLSMDLVAPPPPTTARAEPTDFEVSRTARAETEEPVTTAKAAPPAAPESDLSADPTVAPGTGVIAVKSGGKTKLAKVNKAYDKPPERPTYFPPYYTPPEPVSSGPKVYGEPTPEEIAAEQRKKDYARSRTTKGPLIKESMPEESETYSGSGYTRPARARRY